MKRMISDLVTGLLIVLLGACSDPPVAVPEEKDPIELTAQEILQKSSDAYNDLRSMVALVEATQSSQEQSNDVVNEAVISSELELLLDPTNAHDVIGIHELTRIIRRTLFEHGTEEIEEYAFEQYKSPEGLFRKYPDADGWSKLLDQEYDGISDSLNIKDPRLDVSLFQTVADDFTINQNNQNYILKLSGIGEEFKHLLLEVLLLHGYTEESITANEKQLASMKIETFDVELSIDKETFHTTAFRINLDLEMEIEFYDYHEVQRIAENVKVDIHQINQLESIQVPQQIIDTAVDVDW